MTREEQGRDPQDVERPLASTRWSEAGAAPDDTLLPPFMPGRSRQPPAEYAPESADSQPEPQSPAESDWAGVEPEVVEPVSGGSVTDHQDAVADTGETVTSQDEAVTEEEAFPFETPGAWDEPYSLDSDSRDAGAGEPAGEPWGEARAEPRDAEETAAEPWDAEETAAEPWDANEAAESWAAGEAAAEPWDAEGPAAEPWDAESAAEEPWAADEPAMGDEGRDQDAGGDAVAELAARLEELVGRLRAEGAAGARAGMTSSDRLTALLSTLIAGYLEGREG
jgi:hypothetical protein